MAVFETSRALSEGARHNPTNLFTRIAGMIMAWNDRRLTMKALSALTNRELDDIGLTRGDITNL